MHTTTERYVDRMVFRKLKRVAQDREQNVALTMEGEKKTQPRIQVRKDTEAARLEYRK